MLLLRKIIFYILLLVYVIFCPLIILYALGYQFQPQTRHGLVRTGLIYLSSLPSGATVYLDQKKLDKKTPTVLRGLLEGRYSLRLEAKSVRPWSQVVEVETERASVLDKILLIPQEIPTEMVTQQSFSQLSFIKNSDLLILNRGRKLSDYFFYHLKSKNLTPFLPSKSLWKDSKVEKIFLTDGSSVLVIQVSLEEKIHFLWLDLLSREHKIPKDITRFFDGNPEAILWSPLNRMHLITLQNQTLNHIDLESETFEKGIAKNIQGFTLENWLFLSSIIGLSSEGWLAKINYHGKVEQWLSKDQEFLSSLFNPEDSYQISTYPDNLTIFFGSEGQFLSNRLPYRHAEVDIRGYEAPLEKKRILVWEKERVGYLSFVPEENNQTFFENSPHLDWVYEHAKDVEQAFWVYGGSQILFKDKNKLELLEFETYGNPIVTPLFSVKEATKIYYDDDRGQIYYIDSDTSRLKSAQIVPKRELISLPMLEFKEKKKKIQK